VAEINAYDNGRMIDGESHRLSLSFAINTHQKEFVIYELKVRWIYKADQKMEVDWPDEVKMKELIRSHLDPNYTEQEAENVLDLYYFFKIRKGLTKTVRGKVDLLKALALITSVQWSPAQ